LKSVFDKKVKFLNGKSHDLLHLAGFFKDAKESARVSQMIKSGKFSPLLSLEGQIKALKAHKEYVCKAIELLFALISAPNQGIELSEAQGEFWKG
jgi:hypothetical protein